MKKYKFISIVTLPISYFIFIYKRSYFLFIRPINQLDNIYKSLAYFNIYLAQLFIKFLLAIKAIEPYQKFNQKPIKLGDYQIKNRLGLSAGFQSTGRCLEGLLNLGFGFVQIGSVYYQNQHQFKDQNLIDFQVQYNHSSQNMGALYTVKQLSNVQKLKIISIAPNRKIVLYTPYLLNINLLNCIKQIYQISDIIVINLTGKQLKKYCNYIYENIHLQNLLKDIQFIVCKKIQQKINQSMQQNFNINAIKFPNIFVKLPFSQKESINKISSSQFINGIIVYNDTENQFKSDIIKHIKDNNKTLIYSGNIKQKQKIDELIQKGVDAVQIFSYLIFNGPMSIQKLI